MYRRVELQFRADCFRFVLSQLVQAIVLVAIAIGCIGCSNSSKRDSFDGGQPSDLNLESSEVERSEAEPWVEKTHSEWPQIVLTNQAEFEGHTPLRGASSFLIRTADGRTLAATARHLIGSAGGVKPEIPLSELTPNIRNWKMFPRTKSEDAVEITSIGAQGLDDGDQDWLLLSIKSAQQLPAYPLRLRKEPVRIGETVFLIGCPYSESKCSQNVYTGIVTERGFGNLFRYDIDPSADIRGFSGAPIIDTHGYVVGVMTVWFDPRMSGDKHLEAGGEDAASIYDLVNCQSQ